MCRAGNLQGLIKSSWDIGNTADLLATGASFIPGVGGAINGVYQLGRGAYSAYKGDYADAAIRAGSAVLGLVPGALAASNTLRAGAGAANVARAATGFGNYGRLAQTAAAANAASRIGRTAAAVAPYADPIANTATAANHAYAGRWQDAGYSAENAALGFVTKGVLRGVASVMPAANINATTGSLLFSPRNPQEMQRRVADAASLTPWAARPTVNNPR